MKFQQGDKVKVTYEAELCSAVDDARIWEPLIQGYMKNREIVSVEKVTPPLPNTRDSVIKVTAGDGYVSIFVHDGYVWRTVGGTNMGADLRLLPDDYKVEILNVGKGND